MRVVRWIFGTLLAIVAIAFAVANTQMVSVTWSPLHADLSLPLALVCLAALVLGFIGGALFIWVDHVPVRRERRKQRKTIRKLEDELQTEIAALREPRPAAPPADRPYQIDGPKTLQ